MFLVNQQQNNKLQRRCLSYSRLDTIVTWDHEIHDGYDKLDFFYTLTIK